MSKFDMKTGSIRIIGQGSLDDKLKAELIKKYTEDLDNIEYLEYDDELFDKCPTLSDNPDIQEVNFKEVNISYRVQY